MTNVGKLLAVMCLGYSVFLFWVGCSRDAAIRNSVDAARAVCCLAHIKEGKTPEAAEIACKAVEAVAPFIARTERAATEAEVAHDSERRGDAGTVD